MWETLDLAALLAARDAQHEATTSANAGAYPVPLGGMLKRDYPYGSGGRPPYPTCPEGQMCNLDDDWQMYGQDPQQRRY